jgi:hypothetical protein
MDSTTIRRSALTVAALGALGLGASAIAGAAGNTSSSGSTGSGTTAAQNRPPRPQREELSSDVAAKVKAAALDKLPGATVLRTEGGGPYSTPYHAHVKTADGTLEVVLVNSSFDATAVQADPGRGGMRGRGGPCGPDETQAPARSSRSS